MFSTREGAERDAEGEAGDWLAKMKFFSIPLAGKQ